jgi:hypothetical protein
LDQVTVQIIYMYIYCTAAEQCKFLTWCSMCNLLMLIELVPDKLEYDLPDPLFCQPPSNDTHSSSGLL